MEELLIGANRLIAAPLAGYCIEMKQVRWAATLPDRLLLLLLLIYVASWPLVLSRFDSSGWLEPLPSLSLAFTFARCRFGYCDLVGSDWIWLDLVGFDWIWLDLIGGGRNVSSWLDGDWKIDQLFGSLVAMGWSIDAGLRFGIHLCGPTLPDSWMTILDCVCKTEPSDWIQPEIPKQDSAHTHTHTHTHTHARSHQKWLVFQFTLFFFYTYTHKR